ncbi:hypothetical protein [Flammeovirga aprica]|uniref:Uncharacterized protein n=1 Tax=Flammeovirga aprica JL-4 TaxID=694437 RepID=A0A7X9RU86_9BACT|nr:hypothetical protein [Flammeovirga aprica]NME68806.1 hypothetical protein [Flammeovirga aprica JL-4]
MKITADHTYIIVHFDIHQSWDFFQILELPEAESNALHQQIDHLLYQATLNEQEYDFLAIEYIIAYAFEKKFSLLRNYPKEFFDNVKVECDGETLDFIIDLSETIVKEAAVHLLKNVIKYDLFDYQLLS